MPKFWNLTWDKKDIKSFYGNANLDQFVFNFSGTGPFRMEVTAFASDGSILGSGRLDKNDKLGKVELDNEYLGGLFFLKASELPDNVKRGEADVNFEPQVMVKEGKKLPFVAFKITDATAAALSKVLNPSPPG